jgi:hypothetical protein
MISIISGIELQEYFNIDLCSQKCRNPGETFVLWYFLVNRYFDIAVA